MRIADAVRKVIGPDAPLAYSAYDGSSTTHPDPIGRVTIRDRRAFNHMATSPGELGLARAYVAGYLDLDGDLRDMMMLVARETVGSLTWAERLSVLRMLGVGVLRPVPPPPEE
ncbi:MAG: SAM-dependent methyltransferase, partial [Pseudonocardiaceae bacterium]